MARGLLHIVPDIIQAFDNNYHLTITVCHFVQWYIPHSQVMEKANCSPPHNNATYILPERCIEAFQFFIDTYNTMIAQDLTGCWCYRVSYMSHYFKTEIQSEIHRASIRRVLAYATCDVPSPRDLTYLDDAQLCILDTKVYMSALLNLDKRWNPRSLERELRRTSENCREKQPLLHQFDECDRVNLHARVLGHPTLEAAASLAV